MNYILQAKTEALLSQASDFPWFAHVGEGSLEQSLVVKNWDVAIEKCTSIDYENFGIEMTNHIRRVVRTASVERYQQWNEITAIVRPPIIGMAMSAIERVPVVSQECITAIKLQISRDLIRACIESEYADFFPPGYYLDTFQIYSLGRFPCGWNGDYPQGQRIIY